MDENYFGKGSLDKPDEFLKANAPVHEEIAGAFRPAVWVEKDMADGFVTYPKRNQGTKSDCGCYAMGKALSIDELAENGVWRELSPDAVYPYTFQLGGGTKSLDVANFVIAKGMTLDFLHPSDGLTEAEACDGKCIAVDAKLIGLVYRPSKTIQCATTFEEVASILQGFRDAGLKKGVMITVIGQNNGSWLSTMPQVPSAGHASGYWYHRVIVTDFGLIGGIKVLAIDNSWGDQIGNAGQQFLTQDYEPFIFGGLYTINLPDPTTMAPLPQVKHRWAAPLDLGSRGDDVLKLQLALQTIGMFPIDAVVKPTGYFGGITRQAVKLFQSNFGAPVTGAVDLPTIQLLNQVFGG